MVVFDGVAKGKRHMERGEHAMPDPKLVSTHYTHGSLVDAITAGVHKLGKTVATVSVDDLSPVDEFHVGGRAATEAFLGQLDIRADHHVLDVGCGLGGASRFAATRYNCRVTGIDLTAEYVETGNTLCSWVGLASVCNSASVTARRLPPSCIASCAAAGWTFSASPLPAVASAQPSALSTQSSRSWPK